MRAKNKKPPMKDWNQGKNVILPSLNVESDLHKQMQDVLKVLQKAFKYAKLSDVRRMAYEYYCRQFLSGQIKSFSIPINVQLSENGETN